MDGERANGPNHDTAADRFRKADSLFDAVLDTPDGERDAFIDATCSDDAAFRRELHRLLDAYRRSSRFLESSAVEIARPLIAELEGPTVAGGGTPERVGPFRVERELGHGGMGVVYLATRDDGQFEQRVALKLIRRSGPTVVQRFLEERRILAMLEHPNIARLLDGGVLADGTPYFAMEYVAGQPIDQYCDARQSSTDERLTLFVSLCEAVQYAHQQLVIHRDLKPSNVFVTANGVLKLLDFGVAKLLDPFDIANDETLTGGGPRPMTPDYAAPEQIRGERAGTATDVYGLGVILYVLLTAKRPYELRGRSAAEVERIVCEVDPSPPSAVAESASQRRRFKGDLDRIVLKALRKEPAERYATANDLALDIARHLSGHPVAARRPTAGYRIGRFVKRNRWGVAAGVLVCALLTAYAVTAARSRRRISEALDEALTGTKKTEQVTDFMLGLFEASENGKAFGDTVQARQLLSMGLSRVREMSGQPAIQAQMLEVIGRIYYQLGEYSRAAPLLHEALELERKLPATSMADSASTLESLGSVEQAQQNYDVALDLRRRVLALMKARYGNDNANTANALFSLAVTMHREGKYKDATPIMDEWMRIVRTLPPDTSERRASQLGYQASILEIRGQFAEVEALRREALAINRALYGPHDQRVATNLAELAKLLDYQQRSAEAEPMLREAVEMLRSIYPDGHPRLAVEIRQQGVVLEHLDRLQEAKKPFREAIAMSTAFEGEHSNEVSDAQLDLAYAEAHTGRAREAEALCRTALASLSMKHPATSFLVQRANVCLGDALVEQGRYDEAERLLLTAREAMVAARGVGRGSLATTDRVLVRLYEKQGRESEAAKYRPSPKPR